MDISEAEELLGTKLILECNAWAYAHVSTMFAMFCKPSARGPTFRWDQFASMVADGAAYFVGVSIAYRYERNPTKAKAIEEYVTHKSREWAARMVKMAGFVEK